MIETSKNIQGLSPAEKRALLAQLVQTRSCELKTYSLSYAQQRLWFLAQLAPGVPYYNISTAIPLKIPLNAVVLERTLNEIVRRHESLRTTFKVVNGQPVQLIAPSLHLALPVVDLRELSEPERDAETQRLATLEAHHPFDLVQGPLVRTTLLRLSEQEYVFLLTMHHIVSDGWSMSVFFNELTTLYSAFCLGQPSPLSELSIQYPDFAVWQRQWLQGEVLRSQISYWKQQLADLPVLQLPTDRPRPALPTFQGSFHQVTLSERLTAELKALSQREGVTLFMTLLAAFQTLLHRYTGQDDIVVGSPIANRNRAEIEGLIGFFVNTLVMRTNLSGNPTFREVLRRVREVTLGAYAHQDLPFEKLVEELQPERDLSRNPLFQVMFQLFTAPGSTQKASESPPQPIKIQSGTAHLDLSLDLFEISGGLSGALGYSTDLFDAATITRLAGHFQALLEGIVAHPERRLSELPLLPQLERQQLLVEWNNTATEYPREQCIHQLFEAQVERTPDAIALVYEDNQLSYRELNRRANQLAHHLKGMGVGPESLVGICVERSLEMVVGLLGILKAGGAYLPLDPAYPRERLAFMLEDAKAPWLLTQERLVTQLAEHGAQLLCLDKDWEIIANASGANPESAVKSENLAYVIYTSGSTGRPKGVMIVHRGLCNHLFWMQSTFPLTETDRIPQKYSLSFDVATVEIFAPLLAGARLIITRPGGHLDSAYLVKLMADQKITVVDLVPSLLQLLLEDDGFASCRSLRRIICGGETLPIELQERLFTVLDAELHNLYGPTEATLGSTFWTCQRNSDLRIVPIGRPIANTQLYVLDRHLNPVPVGVCGELYIGGEGVARGYLNRPDLTAEKFIPNPFSQKPGARLYKTGDLTRYLPDGNIEYLGRIDDQVKIRGFRVELGEIEARLRQHPAVHDAVVVVRENGEKPMRVLSDDSDRRLDKEALIQGIMTLGEDLDCILADLEKLSEDETGLLLVQERNGEERNNSTIRMSKRLNIQEKSLDKSRDAYQRVYSLSLNKLELLTLRLNGRILSPVGGGSAGGRRLVAYMVCDPEQAPSTSELRRFLQAQLPDYMVPSTFVTLEALPLTPNGKVDRRALPAPEPGRPEMEESFIEPRTEVERSIATVWQEILGLEKVGVNDNFFDLGGHSLLLVRLRSKLQEFLNVQLTIIDLFQYPTISSLAKYLSQERSESASFQPVHDRAEKQKEVINRLRQQNKLEEIAHE